MRRSVRDNGTSLCFGIAFLLALAGQVIAGWTEFNRPSPRPWGGSPGHQGLASRCQAHGRCSAKSSAPSNRHDVCRESARSRHRLSGMHDFGAA